MSNNPYQCMVCHCEDYQIKQLCCSPGSSCCITCIMNRGVTPQTQCPRCRRQVGKRLKKILIEVMGNNSMINASRQATRNQNRQSMMSSSMILTQKKQQSSRNQQQHMMNPGDYNNYPPPPHQNFIPQNYPYHHSYQMPYYQQNYLNWQPNTYYGHMGSPQIPHGMMMMQYQYPQFPQKRYNNYQQNNQLKGMNNCYLQPPYNDDELEKVVEQRLIKSGKRGLNSGLLRHENYQEDSPQQMPRHLYHGETHSRAFQHQSKTTDILEQTSHNKVFKLNRSNSVNHLTLRR